MGKKHNKAALGWFKLGAEQGYANAQYNLGILYANGFVEFLYHNKWHPQRHSNVRFGLRSQLVNATLYL